MIKEKKKLTKYNFKKTKTQIINEYLRTIACSVLFSMVFTTCLALHARNEMIKDISASSETRQSMDRKIAQQLIESADLMKDLPSKKYSVCLHTGELYETAGDYEKAQFAYELAIQKARPRVYTPYYKLICVLTAQDKLKDAESVLKNVKDHTSKPLIKFKTRSCIVIGDKYYSNGKFLSAAKNYEKAYFYYDKFSKKDNVINESIKYRIIKSYVQAADVMVKTGLNSDAIRFLNKAEKYAPKDYDIRYKLAIILSDSDPEKSVKYLEKLLKERPQDIDNRVYGNAYLKAANIADLDNRPTQAKQYRYKVHSIDMFINNKVVYKNDIEINLLTFAAKKKMFTYPLSAVYSFMNVSNTDIIQMTADFILTYNGKQLECVTKPVATKDSPMYPYAEQPNVVDVKFKKKIFTKKELENYTVEIYLYKDKKFKTHAATSRIPVSK